jgi:hypothetical protein
MKFAIRRAARASDEAGFALATAMFTLAVIGALLAGSFLPARLEQQSGYNVSYASEAREAAEAGLVQTVGVVEAAALEPLVAGGAALDLGTTTLTEMITVHTTVARLTNRVFIIKSQGTRHDASGGALATRSLGLLIRVGAAAAEAGAPLVAIPLTERSWVRLY